MKVYISSHDRWSALYVASILSGAGHEIGSTWHDGPVARSAKLDDAEKAAIADRNLKQIVASDALVMIAAPDMVPGGKFIETGIAAGLGKRVIILGRRENILAHLSCIKAVDDPWDIPDLLS